MTILPVHATWRERCEVDVCASVGQLVINHNAARTARAAGAVTQVEVGVDTQFGVDAVEVRVDPSMNASVVPPTPKNIRSVVPL